MIFFENISKVLNRKLKEEKVISQVEFANRLGVTPVAVNKWLKGGAIESSKIPMICEILNITPNELFGIENELDSEKALKLYEAYKEHPEFQKSIDMLLGIDNK
jgi:transcriptional regulator with XRE-family HTH domain